MAVKDWFDADYYFQSKLAQLGSGWDALELKKAFTDAGYEGEEGLYQHFLDFGNDEGVSPNKYFDTNYYVQAKAADYFGVSAEAVTPDQITFIKKAFADNGMTAWDHYTQFGTAEEIDPSASFDTSVYLVNKLAEWNKESTVEHTMEDLKAALKNADYNAVSHYLDYGREEGIEIADSAEHGAAAQSLSSNADILYGTTGSTTLDAQGSVIVNTVYDDVFNAGAGTLGDNDVINGLGGTDTLNAVLINHQNTIQPTLNSVEVVKFQAQESAGSQQATTNYNNITHSQIDAGHISGMTQLWDTDSRATLIVEDVRTDSNKLDIHMQDTDPGDVDFGVYFNPLNLKPDTVSSNDTATLQVMDVKNAQLSGGESPLTEQPFDKFTFDYASTSGTVQVALQFRPADKALYTGKDATYDTLLTAFNNALDDYEAENPSMDGLFEIAKGGAFSATTTVKGTTYTSNAGFDVKIAAVGGTIDVVAEGTGWGVQSGNVPSVGGIVWNAVTDPDSTCPLIVTDLYLDNVGKVNWNATPDSDCLPDDVLFGSQAGDVVIGSMADRGGVERINVTVDEGSWLSTLASTNETLRMVTAVNGDNNDGNLLIGQSLVPTGSDRDLATWADAAMYLSTDGLKDVAVFDAATFEGNMNLGASITKSSFDKYLKDVDDVDSTTVKDAPLSGYNGAFTYNLGTGSDALNLTVNSGIAADRDFDMVINAGAGDDQIRFSFNKNDTDAGQGSFATPNQLEDQQALMNVVINAGDGDDTIELPGNGNVIVNAGAGNDVVYTDNTAAKAVWVLNAGNDPAALQIHNTAVNGAQPLNNDILSTGDSALTFTGVVTSGTTVEVTVTFQGIESTVTVATLTAATKTTTQTVDGEVVRQAIIQAINGNDRLGEMLAAKDGAGYSLLVESLIDGKMVDDDLAIAFTTMLNGKAASGITMSGDAAYNAPAFAQEGELLQTAEEETPGDPGVQEVQTHVLGTLVDGAYTLTIAGATLVTDALNTPTADSLLAAINAKVTAETPVTIELNAAKDALVMTYNDAATNDTTLATLTTTDYAGGGTTITTPGVAPTAEEQSMDFTTLPEAGDYFFNVAGVDYAVTLAAAQVDTIDHLAAALDTALDAANIEVKVDGTTATQLNFTATGDNVGVNLDAITMATGILEVSGADGVADTDNVIAGNAGDDLIVLATGLQAEETVVFDGSFGHDTVVNFMTGAFTADSGTGVDQLDFTDFYAGNTVSAQIDVATHTTYAINSVYGLAGAGKTVAEMITAINAYKAGTSHDAGSMVFVVDDIKDAEDSQVYVFTASVAKDSDDITGAANVGSVTLAGVETSVDTDGLGAIAVA